MTERPPLNRIKTRLEEVGPGDWFLPVTIKGIDQEALIERAFERGAAGTYLSSARAVLFKDRTFPRIVVSDLRQTLFQLAREARAARPGVNVVAFTGSNGKTTVKEMLRAILGARAPTRFTLANLNTKIGIGSATSSLEAGDRHFVAEVGARKVRDLEVPLAMLKPDVVGCLNIGEAHLGEFGSLEALERTKLSVYETAGARVAVAAADDARIVKAARASGLLLVSFGWADGADVRVRAARPDPVARVTRIALEIRGRAHEFSVRGAQYSHAINLAAAVAFALASGVGDAGVIHEGLARFEPAPRRFEIQGPAARLTIDDSFNSSPTSLKEGLRNLRALFPEEPPVLVLGSMLELGEESEKLHRACGAFIAEEIRPEALILVGKDAEAFGRGAEEAGFARERIARFADVGELLADWPRSVSEARLLYLKGSRAMDLDRVAERRARKPIAGMKFN